MKKGYYSNQALKLNKALNRYLSRFEKPLKVKFGPDKTASIIEKAKKHYPNMITDIPFFNTPMYDSLILLCSRMLAVKKAMKEEGLGVEEFVVFNIEVSREKGKRVPAIVRRLLGRIYLSKPVRIYLKRVARSASANGWPTEIIDGKRSDGFNMKICTRECGMVDFIRAVGEDDFILYCSVFDFTMAETMRIGLDHLSSIDTGKCVYAMSRKGKVEWPGSIRKLLAK